MHNLHLGIVAVWVFWVPRSTPGASHILLLGTPMGGGGSGVSQQPFFWPPRSFQPLKLGEGVREPMPWFKSRSMGVDVHLRPRTAKGPDCQQILRCPSHWQPVFLHCCPRVAFHGPPPPAPHTANGGARIGAFSAICWHPPPPSFWP